MMVATPIQIDGRPPSPPGLTPFQTELWLATTKSEAVGMFRTSASLNLLTQYVRHTQAAALLASAIDGFKTIWIRDDTGLDRLERLLKSRDREVKALSAIARKMRVTAQSRYTPKAAGTASVNSSMMPKPGEPVPA